MENLLQHPPPVPDHRSSVSDELSVNIILVQPGHDFVSQEATISRDLFLPSFDSAASIIFSQLRIKFSPEEQSFIQEHITVLSGLMRENEVGKIYVYILVVETVEEGDGEETVTTCVPLVYLEKPKESTMDHLRRYSSYSREKARAIGRRFRRNLSNMEKVLQKFGESLKEETIKEDSDSEGSCSICLADFKAGSQAMRLPCDHMFCYRCILKWLTRSSCCPLCRLHMKPSDLHQGED